MYNNIHIIWKGDGTGIPNAEPTLINEETRQFTGKQLYRKLS